ncbi:MAG: 23S rRNA (pseudouridine(1915)-N(3))-methyltransferase RlmH [Pseudobdellovibrionaceae bacterium]
MKIEIVSVSSASELWFTEAISVYKKKISYLMDFEVVHLKPNKGHRKVSAEKRVADSDILLSYIKPTDFLVICDEKGKVFTSLVFSKKLESILSSGCKRILFMIGGPYGFSDEIKGKANLMLSLSSLTLNHWLAEVVMAEQIYRALAIQNNLPYHNE